jgi:hypothetical protein
MFRKAGDQLHGNRSCSEAVCCTTQPPTPSSKKLTSQHQPCQHLQLYLLLTLEYVVRRTPLSCLFNCDSLPAVVAKPELKVPSHALFYYYN